MWFPFALAFSVFLRNILITWMIIYVTCNTYTFSLYFTFSFSSLPIDSEKNDRWRKWRKNIWNTGQVPGWGKIGTQRVAFTGTNQTRKIMWNGEMLRYPFCNDNLDHFFPPDLLVLLAYSKKKIYLGKKELFCFLVSLVHH